MSDHHVVPLKTNLITFASLVVLTLVTVWTALYVDIGALNLPLALVIATTKVIIVGLWFMHLKYDSWMNRTIILSALAFVGLLLAISAADIFTR